MPKSGDPQYYHKDVVFDAIKSKKLSIFDAVHTLEYFASYVAVQALTLTDKNIKLPNLVVLFGGGWKNPVVRDAFEQLLSGKGFVLPEYKKQFDEFLSRFSGRPTIRYSQFGEMMEARLFADLARYRLEDKAWEIPEIVQAGQKIVCGQIAFPLGNRGSYDDMLNIAAKGGSTTV